LVEFLRGAARIGKNDIHALADEALDDAVSALHFAANLGLRKRSGGGVIFFHGNELWIENLVSKRSGGAGGKPADERDFVWRSLAGVAGCRSC